MKRLRCSSLETFRKNLTIFVPSRSRWRSKVLMSSNLPFQKDFPTLRTVSFWRLNHSGWTRTARTSS